MSATFVIQIKTNTSGVSASTREVTSELDKVKKKALDVNASLRSIFGVYALTELAKGITGLANDYQAINNKIRTVTDSQENLNGVMDATFKVAQDTRTSWQATTTMYQRMALNNKTLGQSQQELLDFTKHLNQEIIVSGASSKEASNGIIQLAQGMASGRLHGQDLRAVMEDIPGVADIIAKHFNVTRGELYGLGKSGKITGQEIIAAFKESGDSIENAFGKTLPTISQGIELVHNAAMKFFGEAGTGSGVLAALAGALKFVADHFDTIGKVVLAVVQVLGGLFVINEIIKLFKTLAVVVAANPFTALLTLLVTGVLLLRQFGDELNTNVRVWENVSGVFVTVGDELQALWAQFKQVTSAIGDFIKDGWNALTGAFSNGLDATGIEFTLSNVIKMVAAFIYSVTAIFRHLKDLMIEIFGGIPVVLAEKFDESFHSVVDGATKVVNTLIRAINAVHSLISDDTTPLMEKVGKLQDQEQFLQDKRNTLESQRQSGNLYVQAPLGGTVGVVPGAGSPDAAAHNVKIDEMIKTVDAQLAANNDAQKKIAALILKHGSEDLLPEIEFDSKGVKGASDAFKKFSKENLDAIKNEVVSGLEDLDRLSHDFAAKRVQDAKNVGTVGTTHGTPVVTPDPEADKAEKKLEAELDSLIKRGQKEASALQQLRDAQKLLDNPMSEGILNRVFGTTGAAVLDSFRAKLSPILDMVDHYITKTIEESAAMKGSREEEQLEVAVLEVLNKAKAEGITVTQAQENEIRRVTALSQDRNRVWREEQKIIDEVMGPEKQYVLALRAINKALEDQAINQHQANAARQEAARALLNSPGGGYNAMQNGTFSDLTLQSADDNPTALTKGFDEGLKNITQSMLDTANTVRDAMQSTFSALEKFILDAAETGKLSWADLGSSIIQELNKVALKILETWLLTTLLNGLSGGSSGIVGDVAGAISSGPGSSAGLSGFTQGVTQGGAHASGGSYTYPGHGSIDSRSVMFRMSPGERVDFTPPGRTAEANGRKGGKTAGPSRDGGTKVFMVDGRSIIGSLGSAEGERMILQIIAKNAKTIKGFQ